MRDAGLDARWLTALRISALSAPLRPRVPLLAGQHAIGSVEPDFLRQIMPLLSPNGREMLQIEEQGSDRGGLAWRVHGNPTDSLALLAGALRERGLCGTWRNEQLAVYDSTGQRLGSVERAAVRPLGISTQAVHLMGFVSRSGPDSHVWVQQRALDKANDPGRWDTLMGGMIGSQDSLTGALARETWEEAGLQLDDLEEVSYGGRVSLRRPAQEAKHAMGGAGFMVEHIDWFRCSVPEGLVPQNQDGEVAQFVLMDRRELLARLQRDEFTTEAALVLVASLGY